MKTVGKVLFAPSLILGVLFLVCLLGIFRTIGDHFWDNEEAGVQTGATPSPTTGSREFRNSLAPSSLPRSGHLNLSQPADAVPSPPLPKAALPNEQILVFDSADSRRAFRDFVERAGFRILGDSDQLNALRIGGDPARIRQLAKELGQGEPGYNLTMAAPLMPDPAFWGSEGIGFQGDPKSFLGMSEVSANLDWGTGVTVAVLDTGVGEHILLPSDRLRSVDLVQSSTGAGPMDAHGTAVAGLIAAYSEEFSGIAPGVDLLSVRVLDSDGLGDSFTVANGIVQAVDMGADIINLSLGTSSNNAVMEVAIRYAEEAGVLLVAAAGNDGMQGVSWPAAHPQVLGVGAVDAAGDRANFSSYGEGIDILAPGMELYGLWDNDEVVYFDGTSAASALVSGSAARAIELGLASSSTELRYLLRGMANEGGPPGPDEQFGSGVLNIRRIEQAAGSTIHDLAVADIYPATELLSAGAFPLYVTVQNQGTTQIDSGSVELDFNGVKSNKRIYSLQPGEIQSFQLTVSEARLLQDTAMNVTARVRTDSEVADDYPENDAAGIEMRIRPQPIEIPE